MMMKRRTTILLALICCVFVACSRGDEIEVESDSPTLDELDAEYDDDELDDVDYTVEEMIFESPQDIEDLTKTALKEFALKVRKEEGLKGYPLTGVQVMELLPNEPEYKRNGVVIFQRIIKLN